MIVAVHPGNLLHDVVFHGNIARGTPGGGGNLHIVAFDLNIKAQFFQLCADHLIGKIFSKALCQPVQTHINLRAHGLFYMAVAVTGHLHVRIQFFEILHGKGEGLIAPLGINGFFIS